ncbi:MAG: TIM barrel protein [Desulfovibrionaceae bacterium]|nr:TIM barrel protein [Desulfovibrionaceae bacterium]
MPHFAANLTMMFTEKAFPDRFQAAADAGFRRAEFLFPYAWSADFLAEKAGKANISVVLFNAFPGNWEKGERGLACIPGRNADFDAGLEMAISWAGVLRCPRIHVMSGNRPAGVSEEEMEAVWFSNMARAADRCADAGLEICLEPINHISMPQYFLRTQEQAADYIQRLQRKNIRLQFDFFHCQMEQGNVSARFQKLLPFIGHCQIAGVPDRHEPDSGELSFPHICRLLDDSGYTGSVGCEYNPDGRTEDGLGWFVPWKNQ